jgi:hypothetical protein
VCVCVCIWIDAECCFGSFCQLRESQTQRLAQKIEADENFILSGLGRPGGGAPLSSNVYGERGTPLHQQNQNQAQRGGVPWATAQDNVPTPSGEYVCVCVCVCMCACVFWDAFGGMC